MFKGDEWKFYRLSSDICVHVHECVNWDSEFNVVLWASGLCSSLKCESCVLLIWRHLISLSHSVCGCVCTRVCLASRYPISLALSKCNWICMYVLMWRQSAVMVTAYCHGLCPHIIIYLHALTEKPTHIQYIVHAVFVASNFFCTVKEKET